MTGEASTRIYEPTRIYGPHFEHLARTWCAEHPAPGTLGGNASLVGPTDIACREHGTNHQIDVVVVEQASRLAGRSSCPAPPPRHGAAPAVLPVRVTADLRREARSRGVVELVDPNRLYEGT